MISKLDQSKQLAYQRKKLCEEFKAFNEDFPIDNTKEYYDYVNNNDFLDKIIENQFTFKPNFVMEEDTDPSKFPALENCITSTQYFQDDDQPYLEYRKSIINQYLYLQAVLKNKHIRLVIPSSLENSIFGLHKIFLPLTNYKCDICFDNKERYEYEKINNKYKTHAYYVYFEVENNELEFEKVAKNGLVFHDKRPLAINNSNDLDTILTVNNNIENRIEASAIYTGYVSDFCNKNANLDKFVDALSAIMYLYNENHFVSLDTENYIEKYVTIIDKICEEEQISIKEIKTVMASLIKSLNIRRKDVLYLVFNRLESAYGYDDDKRTR